MRHKSVEFDPEAMLAEHYKAIIAQLQQVIQFLYELYPKHNTTANL